MTRRTLRYVAGITRLICLVVVVVVILADTCAAFKTKQPHRRVVSHSSSGRNNQRTLLSTPTKFSQLGSSISSTSSSSTQRNQRPLIPPFISQRVQRVKDISLQKEIIKDVNDNEAKINHHGKRADAIVKGMLQHSRSSSGKKEPTNINALADEYLRLAYHGLRAKDKLFNAKMVTDFDPNIGNVNVIPQDTGRVILNLITNAFYAVNEKKMKGMEGYEPTVTVSTKKEGNKLFITVKDNGSGIPEKVKEKIFQPFFTTKPTGEGTGLGLSMSYDIITKGHGGDLLVYSEEGKETEFKIILPI